MKMRAEQMNNLDWVAGDISGLKIPAHGEALRAGGATFLTDAFHAMGALAAGNRVARITQCEECPGGSTGRKLLLSVEYDKAERGLHNELFVKFSRDFDNALRDRARNQMEREVRFAALSRSPQFPIAVPVCYFADYHAESGTGILIAERIAFGKGSIERHYEKCLDDEMPEALEHYKALVRSIARLAGTHKAGRLPESVAQQFPFEPGELSVSNRASYTPEQLRRRVARYAEFAEKYPQLLPANIRSVEFIARLGDEIPRFPEYEPAVKQLLQSKPEFIALCHWNANIDNAWFWRNAHGDLECGLLDWGHVSQMNMAMTLWGSLSSAESEIWDHHRDTLLEIFVAEVRNSGGPAIDVEELKRHLLLYIAMMGVTWLLDAPALILSHVPDLDLARNRIDPKIKASELARAQIQMMTTFLSLWQSEDIGRILTTLVPAHS